MEVFHPALKSRPHKGNGLKLPSKCMKKHPSNLELKSSFKDQSQDMGVQKPARIMKKLSFKTDEKSVRGQTENEKKSEMSQKSTSRLDIKKESIKLEVDNLQTIRRGGARKNLTQLAITKKNETEIGYLSDKKRSLGDFESPERQKYSNRSPTSRREESVDPSPKRTGKTSKGSIFVSLDPQLNQRKSGTEYVQVEDPKLNQHPEKNTGFNMRKKSESIAQVLISNLNQVDTPDLDSKERPLVRNPHRFSTQILNLQPNQHLLQQGQKEDELVGKNNNPYHDFLKRQKQQKQDENKELLLELKKNTKIQWKPLQDETFPEIETQLKIGFKMGEGSFASVYEGFDKLIRRNVAIKIFEKSKVIQNERRMELIEKEVGIISKLPPHPNVCEFYRLCEDRKKVNF